MKRETDWIQLGMKVCMPPLLIRGSPGDSGVDPSSISPMWGMQTVDVSMVTADLGCHSFKTFC